MRILFFSHYYPPEVNAPAARTSEHCRSWAKAGHDVTVVASAPNHPHGKIFQGYRNRLYQVEEADGVRVVRLWTLLAANQGVLRRAANYLSYFVAAVIALPLLPPADVVVSTSPQFFCGLVGLFARPFKRAPWVLEIRDLWPESIVTVGAMRGGLATRFVERLETLAYRQADAIVSVTRSFVPHIAARRGDAETIAVIPNGADLRLFARGDDGASARRALGVEGKFVATYVGTVGMAHGLTTLLDAAEILAGEPRFVFLIVGDGAERARLRAESERRGLRNVRFLGQRPKAEIPAIWSATDAALVLLKRSDAFKKVLPSKMAEAMAMECPVILGVEGEARVMLDEAEAGIGITPENAEELAAALRRLAADPARAAAFGRAGRAYVYQHLDRQTLAARYLSMLEATAETRSGHRPGWLARLGRAWRFGRHIPLRRVVRRLWLMSRRSRQNFGRLARRPPPALAGAPPRPIFPPRAAGLVLSWEGLAFTFLGRTHRMRGAVDWNAPDASAQSQLWRMNLHYMEYLEGVDDRLFLSLVSDWIAANPPGRPGAWKDAWSAYALSIRVVVWMQRIAMRDLAGDALAPVVASLAAQLRFLEGALETDIGGNHLVKNVKALLWGACFFEGPEAERWRRAGSKALSAVPREQILPDGWHYERSPSYHCQVFADLLECREASRGPTPELDEVLSAMAQVIVDIAHPDGDIAQFNDSGISMAYPPGVCLDAFEAAFASRPHPRPSFAYPNAGYYGLRVGGNYLVIDCGRIGPDELPAHAHGDILSFEWSVAGQRIVVDPGVHEYFGGERRTRSRSAAAHNTLCFEDADQAEFFAAFRCGRRPDPVVTRLELADDRLVLEGSHDGFRHLPGAPRHLRRFEATAGSLRIVDRIEGRPDRAARLGFLFHPEVAVADLGDGVRLTRGDAIVVLRSTGRIVVDDAVHWPDMGVERATRRARVAMDRDVGEVITTFEVAMPQAARFPEIS